MISWFRRRRVPLQADGCRNCLHFVNNPLEMERLIPGLSSFCSGAASVRADDGLCNLHGRYLRASESCAQWLSDQGD
jgi:hypothetical protein